MHTTVCANIAPTNQLCFYTLSNATLINLGKAHGALHTVTIAHIVHSPPPPPPPPPCATGVTP